MEDHVVAPLVVLRKQGSAGEQHRGQDESPELRSFQHKGIEKLPTFYAIRRPARAAHFHCSLQLWAQPSGRSDLSTRCRFGGFRKVVSIFLEIHSAAPKANAL